MQERTEFNPKQLTSARISRGMTMKMLAEKANISRQMISNYESGKTKPQTENLLKIISVLKFPISFFLNDIPEPLNGATYFRSQSAATKRGRDMQKEKLKYFEFVYQKLSKYVNFPVLNIPDSIEKDISEITDEDISNKASELRVLWRIDSVSPIKNLVKISEQNGLLLARANMSDGTLDAVSRWMNGRPFIMLTDNGESAVRLRFNIAHEIGHLLLHGAIESIHDYSPKELKKIEHQANLFASYFLMPDQAFMDSLLSTSLEFYIELKKHWGVSIAAMIYKTNQLGIINEDRYLYLNKQISYKKWRLKEPLDDTMDIEKTTLFEQVFQMIVDNNVVSSNELRQELLLPLDELEKIIGLKISHFEEEVEQTPVLRLIK